MKYLRDELDWPIASDDFEDLTFDYTPEELGIDSKNAAKIQEIKRLRPLSVNQPWGVFFVKFEPKRLPVVALRRILNSVVRKKRASANRSERAAWDAEDLLFISNYGEGDARQIMFAHFSQGLERGELPTLKVLGWDNLDTLLHIDDVAETLSEHLAWPEDETDVEGWRNKWGLAFVVRHREVIRTSRELSIRLAELARSIRDRIRTALAIETEAGPLTRLMKAFREALVHDLDADGFADMYAQTIAYGLLSARIANPGAETADRALAEIPVTNPFLKELMQTFLHIGGQHGKAGGPGIDFDELGVSEVVELLDDANMEAVVRDFGDKNPQEDPVIHFYELFLKEYDAKKRMQRGVFYTPRPVVSYIVRSIHELLQTEFGLDDGLADTATWGEMAKRQAGVAIPDGVKPTDGFVNVLDPATGTGTFLVEAIEVMHQALVSKWKRDGYDEDKIVDLWNDYVPTHLLPRLHGYELLMAPYAIAHLKIGLKLYETGYRFGSDERARIYLTNSLEPAQELVGRLEFTIPALAHEALAVDAIKRGRRFTVVIGNPPYSASLTTTPWIKQLMNEWKKGVAETKMDVMREEWKFLRLAQYHIATTGIGINGFVINRDFLDGITKRRLRESLQESYTFRRILDLNGDVKGEIADENVFDIQQGVCISLLATSPARSEQTYRSLEGTRDSKYRALLRDELAGSPHAPNSPLFKWSAREQQAGGAEYESWVPLNEVFNSYSSGIQTQRDTVCIHFDAESVWRVVQMIASLPLEEAREELGAGADGRDWQMKAVRTDILNSGPSRTNIARVLYRPFDFRYTYWTGKTKGFHAYPRREVMQHMVDGRGIGLIFNRQVVGKAVSHFGISRIPTCWGVFYLGNKGSDYLAPLFLKDESLLASGSSGRSSNLSEAWLSGLDSMGISSADMNPELSLSYIYAVVHSSQYRELYAERLKEDFARIPPPNPRMLRLLSPLGSELVSLHTMDSPKLDDFITTYSGSKNPEVGRVDWAGGAVWLDSVATKKSQVATRGTTCFRGVPEAVWDFHIGGYQVCKKWLKDRKGRTLSKDDIAHYQRIVVAIAETIRLMAEIDEVIEAHGGWPRAFASHDTPRPVPSRRRRHDGSHVAAG